LPISNKNIFVHLAPKKSKFCPIFITFTYTFCKQIIVLPTYRLDSLKGPVGNVEKHIFILGLTRNYESAYRVCTCTCAMQHMLNTSCTEMGNNGFSDKRHFISEIQYVMQAVQH
jgi:hypothetical protein